MTDTQQKIDKLAEHIANLEAEVALLNNAVSAQPTLRDQFAMAIVGGYMATNCALNDDSAAWAAEHAYQVADAMLKEREK